MREDVSTRSEQQDDRFQAMNTRYETMKKHAKSLTDLVGSLVEDNRCKYGDEENEKRRKKTKTYAYM